MAYVAQLGNDFDRFKADFDVVGKHIGNAQSKYSEAERRLDRFEASWSAPATRRSSRQSSSTSRGRWTPPSPASYDSGRCPCATSFGGVDVTAARSLMRRRR